MVAVLRKQSYHGLRILGMCCLSQCIVFSVTPNGVIDVEKNKQAKAQSDRSDDYIKAGYNYPIGSVVFSVVISGSSLLVKHVSLVVGQREGSPLVVHAANSAKCKHVVKNRLRTYAEDGKTKMQYIVIPMLV